MNPNTFKHMAWLMAFGMGFLSLSEEILWVRVVTFAKHGIPQSFAFVLSMFLLGVALGAALGRRACAGPAPRTLRHGIVLVIAASLLDLALPSLITCIASLSFDALLLAPLIILSSGLKATLFPIAHHLGSNIEGHQAGRSISRVYFMNIAGSTLGPILTGFVLLDHLSAESLFLLIGIAGIALASLLSLQMAMRTALAGLAAACTGGAALPADHHAMIQALAGETPETHITHVIENRQGIIHTVDDGGASDAVFGGNVYDGRTNIDIVSNSNRIDRVYLLATLHPAPRRMLVIGLSTGAWTRVLSSFPAVEHIDVVEINPGYVELIETYPHIAPILSDPRIHIHIDDGRRWLRTHQDERFDLIVMNTTFHWRAHITNLLSIDFMHMARRHLAPSGILAFNATGSPDAFFTASQAFPYAFRWGNFIYASDHDFRPQDAETARSSLLALQWHDETALDGAKHEVHDSIDRIIATPFATVEDARRETGRDLDVITDQNMITEYRHGPGL